MKPLSLLTFESTTYMNRNTNSAWPDDGQLPALREYAASLASVVLKPRDLARLELLLSGYLAPMNSFEIDAKLNLDWTIDPGDKTGDRTDVSIGDALSLQDPEGALCAILTLSNIRTDASEGIEVQGTLQGVERPQHPLYERYRHDLYQARTQLSELQPQNWIAVPLLKILPRDDWEVLRQQADSLNAGLLLMVPDTLDRNQTMDLRQRMAMAQAVSHELGEERTTILICPASGEGNTQLSQSIDTRIAHNLGCTHLAVFSRQSQLELHNDIQPISLTSGANPFDSEHQYPRALQALEALRPAPGGQGFCVFLTGLSGSGKSTIARHLEARLLEHGTRPVSLLDGDIIRAHLSSELGFSKTHRDLNIRRIGYVASEIVKHRGIAICAPIAPYSATRAAVRAMIESHGAFIEIHIATPVEVCEARDRKGLYAKARAGLIPEFTGISDPYEAPEFPQLRLDTQEISCQDSVEAIIACLNQLDLWHPQVT